MMRFLDKLNLRPGERRLVVLVAFTVFIVLNLIFVWPHFGEFKVATAKLNKACFDLGNYERKVQQTGLYKTRLAEYEKDNPEVPTEDQGVQFQRAIQQQAAQSAVNVTTFSRATTKTNSIFFVEQLQTISVQTTETNLVDFLYNLGAGQSLIRVRELSLRPDQPRYNLGGNITLVASYQKKAPVKGAAATASKPATTEAPAPKPLTAPKPAVPAVSKPLTNRVPATAVRPPGGTNAAAASPSVWSKMKGWFGSSSTNPPPATVKPKPAAPKTPGTPPAGPKLPVPSNRPPPGSPPTGQPPQP